MEPRVKKYIIRSECKVCDIYIGNAGRGGARTNRREGKLDNTPISVQCLDPVRGIK